MNRWMVVGDLLIDPPRTPGLWIRISVSSWTECSGIGDIYYIRSYPIATQLDLLQGKEGPVNPSIPLSSRNSLHAVPTSGIVLHQVKTRTHCTSMSDSHSEDFIR